MHYVYILRCKDGTLYTGYTTNIERRLLEHNESKKAAKYTRGRRPVSLYHVERFRNEGKAKKRESEIKSLTREEKEKLKKDD